MRYFPPQCKLDRILQGEQTGEQKRKSWREKREKTLWRDSAEEIHRNIQTNFLEQLFWNQELGKVIDVPHRH